MEALRWLERRTILTGGTKLHGLLAHWSEVADAPWIEPLIHWEEDERARRGLESRLKGAHLGRFKPLADFDWHWLSQCDRPADEELMRLSFVTKTANAVAPFFYRATFKPAVLLHFQAGANE